MGVHREKTFAPNGVPSTSETRVRYSKFETRSSLETWCTPGSHFSGPASGGVTEMIRSSGVGPWSSPSQPSRTQERRRAEARIGTRP